MKYTVYEWHTSNIVAKELTVEEIVALNYDYIKFNKRNQIAFVTNCCNFKFH